MSFVPLEGTAVFRPAQPPRDSVVEFSDERRTVTLPMRAALPVLSKACRRDDVPPGTALLGAATLLAMRLVAAGKLEPAGDHWRISPLEAADEERVAQLAAARAYDGMEAAQAATVIRQVLDAVADALPRGAPGPVAAPRGFTQALQERLQQHHLTPGAALPHLVTISLRVEADEEELAAGSVRLVLQVHDEQNPLHLCDAALLWAETGPRASHGFGERARTHATIALRGAADAWPVLDRLLELRVPDQITLDTDELVGLLDDGVGALKERGVDVLWPRSLGRDLTVTTVLDRTSGEAREGELVKGLLGTEALFAFRWQVALHGEALTADELDRLASATSPLLKLRDNWMVVDPAVARKAKKRLVRTAKPAEAVAAALSGVVEVDDTAHEVVVGASLLKVRDQLLTAATRDPIAPPAALHARLRDYQRHGLTWLVELTDLGLGACLADDMGLGKTVTVIALHLHRRGLDTVAAQPARPAIEGDRRASAGTRPASEGAVKPEGAVGLPTDVTPVGATLVVCPASLLGNWEAEIGRFAPGTPVRRFHGAQRDLTGLEGTVDQGFVLTTYGTMRRDAAVLAEVAWDLVVADEAQHVKNARSSTARALRTIPSRARVALTGTPVENNLTELWAILDWAIPGLLGSRNAFRKVWAGPIESGLEPSKARRFAELIGPFLLRRRKSDPGIAPELPAKTETDHVLGLTREQVVLYEAFVRDTMERIERADEHTRRGLVLKLLTGLKQICNHPAQFLKQTTPQLSGRSQKFDAVDELVGTVLAEDGAVLLFTQYVAMARLLETHLARAGVPHQFLHGGTAVREREAMVARFQAGEVPVFLLSLKAGGTGLNLTRADHVIHVDRWWNPAVEEQATDRAYRIGQTRPVQVHRLLTQGTIEERVAELLRRKRALADSVLARGEGALTELGDAELRDLVSLRPPADGWHHEDLG